METSKIHTGLTGDVQVFDDRVVALLDEGKREEAQALYKRGKSLMEGTMDRIGARLRTISAPSVSVKPGETERRIIAPEEAMDLLQGRVFGGDKMQTAFGYPPDQIPVIPGSTLEFRNAARLGQSLRLCAPLTMLEVESKIKTVNALKPEGYRRKALCSIDQPDCWYRDQKFACVQKPQAHWALTSGEPVEGTFSKDCLQQQDLLKVVLEASFEGMEMPQAYIDALAEYAQKRAQIQQLMYEGKWSEASFHWSGLSLVNGTFATPAEILNDINVDHENGGSLLMRLFTRTSASASFGNIVSVGGASMYGASVDVWDPDLRYGYLGASFYRRLA